MSIQAVLLPLFVEVALTFVLLYWMAYQRTSSLQAGEIEPRDIALREPNWPPRMAQVANAFQNQLELPVLFYVLTILAWITRHADLLFVVLAGSSSHRASYMPTSMSPVMMSVSAARHTAWARWC
jgi:hypothetical protein